MKKFILLISAIFIFAACSSSSKDVSKMYFYVKDDATVADDYYAYSYLTIVPDHDLMSLDVEFSMIYAGDEQENFETSAEVAEPYYSSFLELSDKILSQELLSKEVDEASTLFQVTLDDNKDNRHEYKTTWGDESVDLELFKSFYLELVDILTVEVPV